MGITERINKLEDDDLMMLLEVLTCKPGKEWEIYNKRRRLLEDTSGTAGSGENQTAAANK